MKLYMNNYLLSKLRFTSCKRYNIVKNKGGALTRYCVTKHLDIMIQQTVDAYVF